MGRACAEVADIFRSGKYTLSHKSPGDPLTSADLRANEILRDGLLQALPQAAWLSEESPEDKTRLKSNLVWVVDPIDGTREFVAGVPQFGVSVGLSDSGRAVLGCVGLPAESLLISGVVPAAEGPSVPRQVPAMSGAQSPTPAQDRPFTGVLRSRLDGSGAIVARESVGLSSLSELSEALVLFSNSEQRAGLGKRMGDLRLEASGSIARKLALLAAGHGDLCVSLRPKNEWDICGGIALVQAAGGMAAHLEGARQPVFNQPSTRSLGLVAGAKPLAEQFLKWAEEQHLTVDQKSSR